MLHPSALCRRPSALCRRLSALCRSLSALCRRSSALCRRPSALCRRSSAHGSPPLNVGYLRSTSETLRLSAEAVRSRTVRFMSECTNGPPYVCLSSPVPSLVPRPSPSSTRACSVRVNLCVGSFSEGEGLIDFIT